MNYRYMGMTGLKVSELCLGTMTFGWTAGEDESRRILDHFVAGGGNFIDTANVYSSGKSEDIVGNWLSGQDRDDLVVATKARFATGDGPNQIGLSRKHIMKAVRESLERLKTDYIDLYQVHAWDPATQVEETLRALSDLVDEGIVMYTGASNFRGWQLQKAIDVSRELGFVQFSCLQPQYSLLCRATELELLPVCINEGLGVIPWSPLRGGWLSGKYTREMSEPPAETRLGDSLKGGNRERWDAFNNEKTWSLLEELKSVAQRSGRTVAQVALNWILCRRGITAPIIGARSVAQLEENMGASGWRLGNEEVKSLDEISRMDITYPYDSFAELQQKRGREDYIPS
jgi:aryl-alcohol dehydrogenase-like predicted oxidoreductase